jgi:hypothetical protein
VIDGHDTLSDGFVGGYGAHQFSALSGEHGADNEF